MLVVVRPTCYQEGPVRVPLCNWGSNTIFGMFLGTLCQNGTLTGPFGLGQTSEAAVAGSNSLGPPLDRLWHDSNMSCWTQ